MRMDWTIILAAGALVLAVFGGIPGIIAIKDHFLRTAIKIDCDR